MVTVWGCELTGNIYKRKELQQIAKASIVNQTPYRAVKLLTGVPWVVIAAIHSWQTNQTFRSHLLNGDPLTAKTTHVPAGRPLEGRPPFTWQQSAVDALTHCWTPAKWDIAGTQTFLERWGQGSHSFLWAYTDKVGGAADNRAGVIAIMESLRNSGVTLDLLS
jgi:lysozyme family protein